MKLILITMNCIYNNSGRRYSTSTSTSVEFELDNLHLSFPMYRLGPVNSKSFIGKVLLRIKWKFELQHFSIVISFDL